VTKWLAPRQRGSAGPTSAARIDARRLRARAPRVRWRPSHPFHPRLCGRGRRSNRDRSREPNAAWTGPATGRGSASGQGTCTLRDDGIPNRREVMPAVSAGEPEEAGERRNVRLPLEHIGRRTGDPGTITARTRELDPCRQQTRRSTSTGPSRANYPQTRSGARPRRAPAIPHRSRTSTGSRRELDTANA
jgi:hypothetical protein